MSPLSRSLICLVASTCATQVAIDYCKANAPLAKDLTSDDIGNAAAFLASPMSGAITGMTVYVDNGMHSMGMVQEVSIEKCRTD